MTLKDNLIKYLEKNTHVSDKWGQSTTITKQQLKNAAFSRGYDNDAIEAALREIDKVVYIGSWWNSERRVVEYIFYPMTEEEIKKREEDNEWFDNL